MKTQNYLIWTTISFLTLFLSSCQYSTECLTGYFSRYVRHEIYNVDTVKLCISKNEDTLKYSYSSSNEENMDISFSIVDSTDSILTIYGHDCPLINQKTFDIEGFGFLINKYLYDTDAIDEETSYYFNKEYGLLISYSLAWHCLDRTLEFDSMTKKLIDLIISDTSGFYMSKHIPPPPPPD
ncbi:MAG: hypothetical protein HN921_16550 [Bacteroidetes bacterium]|nr:hypothetical protein [Cytophagia bacterium]MBT7041440.1 hypothetical protein [Bacteroidota bacterium]MBT7995063.1 hypothetical protein [Bacteroidota bacterium]